MNDKYIEARVQLIKSDFENLKANKMLKALYERELERIEIPTPSINIQNVQGGKRKNGASLSEYDSPQERYTFSKEEIRIKIKQFESAIRRVDVRLSQCNEYERELIINKLIESQTYEKVASDNFRTTSPIKKKIDRILLNLAKKEHICS